jgi:glycosyltransferase involved in cell wall biosynthesis
MRVAFVITDLRVGGAERMLLQLVARLSPRFEPHVISLSDIGPIGEELIRRGISVRALGMRTGMPSVFLFVRLVRWLRGVRPDVVHTWLYHADLLGGLAARFARVPVVAWCIRNGTLDPNTSKRATRIIVRVCALLSRYIPDRIVSCSYRAAQVHAALGYAKRKFVCIPNGFDLAEFAPNAAARDSLRAELSVSKDALLVGLLARFDPQKNHTGFLQAAVAITRCVPNVHFVLAGSGVDATNPQLAHCIDEYGLTGNLHLLGLRSDMPRITAALDVACCASTSGEAFSNALGEAMASEVATVATDVGDNAYILGDTGLLVPAGNVASMAHAISRVLSMSHAERQAMGRRARERVQNLFTIDSVVRQYEAFYLSTLGQANQ